MDLKQLKYFRTIVEHGSFRKAADSLSVSPPALSLSIKSLEDELGLTLLDRKPGKVLPTSFGHSLYNSACKIDSDVQSAFDRLNEIRGIGSGRIAIGMLPYGIPTAMGRLIGRFCDRYPRLTIHTALGSMRYLLSQLENGDLDFLITELQGSVTEKRLVHEPMFNLRYALIARKDHPLAGKRNVTLKRVLEYRLAYARTWQVVLDNWDQTFTDEGLEPPDTYVGEATDDFYIEMISNCNTIAVLPMIGSFQSAIDAGQLTELHVPRLNWSSTVALIYRDKETFSPDVRLLMDEARGMLTGMKF